MAKARRRPSVPVLPVQWIDTPAQRAGTVTEPVRDEQQGKAVRLRRYRQHPLEVMYRQGYLSQAQVQAGLELSRLWLEPQRTPYSEVTVDRSPRPDDATMLRVQALEAYARAMRLLPGRTISEACHEVCCRERQIRAQVHGKEIGLARNGREAFIYRQSLDAGLTTLARAWGFLGS